MSALTTSGSIEVDTPVSLGFKSTDGREKLKYLCLQFLAVAAFVVLWQICSATAIIDPFFISSPSAIWNKLVEWFVGGSIYYHLIVTTREALAGWVLGSIFGVLGGFLFGRIRPLERVFIPLLHLLNTLPRIALAPLFIFWFGIGETSKVILVFTIILFIMVFNTYGGVKATNRNYLLTAKLLGKTEWETLSQVIFPSCVPWIMIGLRLGLAWSLSGAVVGEFIAARAGLGYLIFNASMNLDNTSVLAGCAVLLGVAMLFFFAIAMVEKRLLKWQPKES